MHACGIAGALAELTRVALGKAEQEKMAVPGWSAFHAVEALCSEAHTSAEGVSSWVPSGGPTHKSAIRPCGGTHHEPAIRGHDQSFTCRAYRQQARLEGGHEQEYVPPLNFGANLKHDPALNVEVDVAWELCDGHPVPKASSCEGLPAPAASCCDTHPAPPASSCESDPTTPSSSVASCSAPERKAAESRNMSCHEVDDDAQTRTASLPQQLPDSVQVKVPNASRLWRKWTAHCHAEPLSCPQGGVQAAEVETVGKGAGQRHGLDSSRYAIWSKRLSGLVHQIDDVDEKLVGSIDALVAKGAQLNVSSPVPVDLECSSVHLRDATQKCAEQALFDQTPDPAAPVRAEASSSQIPAAALEQRKYPAAAKPATLKAECAGNNTALVAVPAIASVESLSRGQIPALPQLYPACFPQFSTILSLHCKLLSGSCAKPGEQPKIRRSEDIAAQLADAQDSAQARCQVWCAAHGEHSRAFDCSSQSRASSSQLQHRAVSSGLGSSSQPHSRGSSSQKPRQRALPTCSNAVGPLSVTQQLSNCGQSCSSQGGGSVGWHYPGECWRPVDAFSTVAVPGWLPQLSTGMARQRFFKIVAGSEHPEVEHMVGGVLRELGWLEDQDPSMDTGCYGTGRCDLWNLCWTWTVRARVPESKLLSWQKINHFQECRCAAAELCPGLYFGVDNLS
jgi:hypothetical protein